MLDHITHAYHTDSQHTYLLRKVPRDQGPDEGGLAHLLCQKRLFVGSFAREHTTSINASYHNVEEDAQHQQRAAERADREGNVWVQTGKRVSARLSRSILNITPYENKNTLQL